jgi:hypothetical protein
MFFHDSKFHLLPKKLRSKGIGHFIVKTIDPHGAIGIENQKNGRPLWLIGNILNHSWRTLFQRLHPPL